MLKDQINFLFIIEFFLGKLGSVYSNQELLPFGHDCSPKIDLLSLVNVIRTNRRRKKILEFWY